jgi:NhaP-type Na+/H+ or K+/H+ antiporter
MVAATNFDNLVAVLAVAAAVPLILAAVPRVCVPGPVLEIVAGIVLGPAVLDLVKPDQAVRLVSTIGLAFLLFLAGLEVDVRHFRGPRARLAGLALGLSALLALIIGIALYAAGVVESPLLIGIILLATSLGLITPILEDAGVADRPVGQFAIAGASLGEVTPVVLLSLFFSGRTTGIGPKLLLLSLLGVLVVLVVIGTLRIERSMWITRMINRLADTSAQIRIRLSMLLVVGLGALATHLGFEAILGAFLAGAILRLVDADAEHKHPLFHPETRRHRLWLPHPGLLRHQRAHIQPVGAVLERLHRAAGAALPAGPAGRTRTARRPLPVRPGQHPRCRRRGAAPSDIAALHRRRHHHRASIARHQAGQRGRTRRRRALQCHPFPHHLAAAAAIIC